MVAIGLNHKRRCTNELTFRSCRRANASKVKTASSDGAGANRNFAPDRALNREEAYDRLVKPPISSGQGARTCLGGRRLRGHVNDYDALRDYLKKQRLPEFVLSF